MVSAAPELSVIIPTYNAARYIVETIESVLAQTFSAHEIIVVDDSTDETPQLLEKFGDQIRVIRRRKRGVASARNEGIRAARGQWLAFLDADDLWLPDFEERMLQTATSVAAEVGVICCGWQYTDADGVKVGVPVTPSPASLSLSALVMANRFSIHAAITRRSCCEAVGLFDPSYSQVADWHLWLQIVRNGYRIHPVSLPLVLYRQVPASMSHNVTAHRDEGMVLLDEFYAHAELPPEILQLRESAYGHVMLWAAANLYGEGESEAGLDEFARAIRTYPVLVQDLDTYYAIACAEQPLPLKGTGQELDLGRAQARLREVLAKALDEFPGNPEGLKRQADQFGSLALGELAYRQGNRRAALAGAIRSLARGSGGCACRRAWRLLMKSLIPDGLLHREAS